MSSLIVLGVLGGIGSGKSTVARLFGELGACVIDADRMAHDCLDRPEVRERIGAVFGARCIAAGRVDRETLARMVFEDPAKLSRLNDIVHPCVLAAIDQELDRLRQPRGGPRLAVLDVPLLLEADLHGRCDRLLFVAASQEARAARVRDRRGWTVEELARREKNQKPLDEKEAVADYKIVNEGPIERTRALIRAIHDELVTGRPASPPPGPPRQDSRQT
jgi:dephospho-CoA kinase